MSPKDTSSTGPAPKRMRVSRACEQCRSRKAKCDGKMPICTPCVTLAQRCTYGAEPKKRGLAPGSVLALEKSVQLLQRLFGLLFKNVEGSELAVLALVQEYGESLVGDGEEGKSLSKVWADGLLPAALEGQRRQTTPGSFSQSKATVQRGVRSFLRESAGPEGAQREDPGPAEKYGLEVSRRQRGGAATASSNLQMSPGWIGELDVHVPNLPGPMRNEAPITLGSDESRDIITPLEGSDTVEAELMFSNVISPTPISPDAVAPPYYPTPACSWRRSNQNPSAENQHPWYLADEEATSSIQTNLVEHDFSGQDLPRASRLLLNLYFTYTHVWLPILDKYDLICFFRTVESSSASDSNPKRECMTGKRALLFAVLALASLQYYEEPYVPERHAAPSMYMASQKLLFTPREDSCLEHVQALIILVLYNVSLSHLRPAWLLLGHAGRLSIDLGLNVASTSQFGNRTWQGYLVLDTIVSALMNRDSGLRDNDWEVPVVEETGWEEWDSWKDMNIAMVRPLVSMESSGSDTPARILSRFNILVGLSRLLRRTLFLPLQQAQLRRPCNANQPPEDPEHCGASRHLGLQLDSWKQALLSHTPPGFFALQRQTTMGTTPNEPHASNLCIFYLYVTQQVVARCFCCCRDSSTAIHHDEVWRKSMAVPMASEAKRILDSFRHLRKPGLLSCLFAHIGIHLAESLDPDRLLPGQTKDLLTDFKRITVHEGFRNTNGLLKQADRIQREPPKRTQVMHFDRNGPNPGPFRDLSDSTFISGGFVSSPSASLVPGTTTSASRSEPLTRSNAVEMAINSEPTGAANGGSPHLYDAFDEEMGMLESLSWTHNGIPEFMHNLGYTFSPNADLGSPQSSRHGAQVEEAQDGDTSASLRLGSYPSLEYWLGDMLGNKEHGLD